MASEALYHILGGKHGEWHPEVMRLSKTETHWFLVNDRGDVLDASRKQFKGALPDYRKGRRCGFLTSNPSKRATALIKQLTWQEDSI